MKNRVIGIVIAAVLGVSGGLLAAFVIHPASPRFHPVAAVPSPSPSSMQAQQLSSAGTTVMTVETPSKPLRSDEVDRLKTRNRRLEALVNVLRQREHSRVPAASQKN